MRQKKLKPVYSIGDLVAIAYVDAPPACVMIHTVSCVRWKRKYIYSYRGIIFDGTGFVEDDFWPDEHFETDQIHCYLGHIKSLCLTDAYKVFKAHKRSGSCRLIDCGLKS